VRIRGAAVFAIVCYAVSDLVDASAPKLVKMLGDENEKVRKNAAGALDFTPKEGSPTSPPHQNLRKCWKMKARKCLRVLRSPSASMLRRSFPNFFMFGLNGEAGTSLTLVLVLLGLTRVKHCSSPIHFAVLKAE